MARQENDPEPTNVTTEGELAKEVFEDMQVVMTALRRAGVPGSEEAFERLMRHTARVAINGVGRTAQAMRSAVPRFENLYYAGRTEEHGK